MKTGRTQVMNIINGLIPDGNTRLFNTISEAYNYLQTDGDPRRIRAVVVLTDGADTAKQMTLEQLLGSLKFDAETRTTRVFTIGYGSDAQAGEAQADRGPDAGEIFRREAGEHPGSVQGNCDVLLMLFGSDT